MKTLFLDIGGVVLTNGWDHTQRKEASVKFHIDWEEFSKLHDAYYPLHEEGKITLSEYLEKTIFYKKQSFSQDEFTKYMKSLNHAYDDMINLFKEIKNQGKAKIVFLSNEGRDLASFRISHFNLKAIGDFFIISCFVGIRKPDPNIYQMALDLSQSKKEDILYIDDRKKLVESAFLLGIPSFQHIDYENTKKKLNAWI